MGQILFAPSGAGVTSDDVTATKAQVLSGYTALTSDSDDEAASGSMTNNGAWTSSSSGSGKITVPAGYHNGSGYVDCSGAYNKGVTDADNRTNTNSANYKAGYNAGYANGNNDGKWSVKNGGQNVTLTGVHGAYDDYTFTYQGRPGYNGVIFAITHAEYWIYAGGSVSSVSDDANISTSYNSSNGVITIHAYRHTKLVGTIYYY